MTIYGYARVSTDGQTLDGQEGALREAGADRIFAEKVTGVKTDRAALARCMASLGPGDVLLVTKLDRLARSTRDLLNTLAMEPGLKWPKPLPTDNSRLGGKMKAGDRAATKAELFCPF